jgi:hypothetical protein
MPLIINDYITDYWITGDIVICGKLYDSNELKKNNNDIIKNIDDYVGDHANCFVSNNYQCKNNNSDDGQIKYHTNFPTNFNKTNNNNFNKNNNNNFNKNNNNNFNKNNNNNNNNEKEYSIKHEYKRNNNSKYYKTNNKKYFTDIYNSNNIKILT